MTSYGHRSDVQYLKDILAALRGTLTVSGGSGGVGDASAANQLTEIARLDSILTELGQKLEAGDLAGLALDTSLQSILTELGQKLEPADIAGLSTEATLVLVLAALGNLGLESTLQSILTELEQKLEAADIAGLGLDTSLQSILTELGQKLEPVDIAGLATESTLAGLGLESTLQSILTELGQKLEASGIAGYALDATLQSILTELGQKTEPANTQIVSVLSDIGAANAVAARISVTATATTIASSRATRRGALLLNSGSNRCDIWFTSGAKAYGDTDTYPLSPGESFPIGTVAIIRGICNTALSTEIDVIEVYE